MILATVILTKKISIHVPAWGTTDLSAADIYPFTISIHVPAWGTTTLLANFSQMKRFQSTFPRGERPAE